MKKQTYKKIVITVLLLFLLLPLFDIFLIREFNFSHNETIGLVMPTTILLFFSLVFLGVASEDLKD